jgi:competence ComEA-like helix-hairpin-helix protein
MTRDQERGLIVLLGVSLLVGGAILLWPDGKGVPDVATKPVVISGVTVFSPLVKERGKIHLNSATLSELVELPGIGEALAARIIAYRSDHGPFRSVDDLVGVSGIGPRTVDGLREFATVDDGDAP